MNHPLIGRSHTYTTGSAVNTLKCDKDQVPELVQNVIKYTNFNDTHYCTGHKYIFKLFTGKYLEYSEYQIKTMTGVSNLP